MAAYLTAAFEDGDTAVVVHALEDIARAKGKRHAVELVGLSANGNPELSTVLEVVRALGFRLEVAPVVKRGRARPRESGNSIAGGLRDIGQQSPEGGEENRDDPSGDRQGREESPPRPVRTVVVPVHAELTTQRAAELLNVSRPYVIKLLESGRLPFHKVGTHRRIPAAALFAYKRQQAVHAEETMAELARLSQELELE